MNKIDIQICVIDNNKTIEDIKVNNKSKMWKTVNELFEKHPTAEMKIYFNDVLTYNLKEVVKSSGKHWKINTLEKSKAENSTLNEDEKIENASENLKDISNTSSENELDDVMKTISEFLENDEGEIKKVE